MHELFDGRLLKYQGSRSEVAGSVNANWGTWYIDNPRRNDRPQTQQACCPFCVNWNAADASRPAAPFRFQGDDFVMTPNSYPVVQHHALIVPVKHRDMPTPVDFALLGSLPGLMRTEPLVRGIPAWYGRGRNCNWAVYLNTRGAGRTVDHLHLHAVPVDLIPMSPMVPAEEICRSESLGVILNVCSDSNFYSILVSGDNIAAMAAALTTIHMVLTEAQVPYNLIVQPIAPDRTIRIMCVPRTVERCAGVNTSVAGFELLTGMLVPDSLPDSPITVAQRDAAFRSVSLNAYQASQLERRLRVAL